MPPVSAARSADPYSARYLRINDPACRAHRGTPLSIANQCVFSHVLILQPPKIPPLRQSIWPLLPVPNHTLERRMLTLGPERSVDERIALRGCVSRFHDPPGGMPGIGDGGSTTADRVTTGSPGAGPNPAERA